MDYMIIAPKRSGHHAIVNWLCYRVGDLVTHYNNVHAVGETLVSDKLTPYVNRTQEPFVVSGLSTSFHLPKHVNLMSFENPTEKTLDVWFANVILCADDLNLVVVLRDVRNVIASCLRYEDSHPRVKLVKAAVESWKFLAEGSLKETSRQTNTIFFDRWFIDPDYREATCRRLGVRHGDEGINDIPKFGGGSSFSQYLNDGHAQLMSGVIMRYKGMQDRKEYRELFEPVRDLNDELLHKFFE